MENPNFSPIQGPPVTPSKKGLIAGIIAITTFIAVGAFSYFSLGTSSDTLPPAPPETASQFQGKLDKDGMGILKKSKEDNKGEAKYKSESVKVLKAGNFHWGYFENAKNLNDVVERADVKTDETKLVYLTYDPTLLTKGQWVTSPEKVYIGTKSIDVDGFTSYGLKGGGLISSTKDLTAYGFNQGETPTKNFKCENLHSGWQITLAPKNANNDYTFYEDCLPSSIWEYDPNSKDTKRPFKQIPTANLDTKITNYLHWVKYDRLTAKKASEEQKTPASHVKPAERQKKEDTQVTKRLTLTIDNATTPAKQNVEGGAKSIKVAEFTLNISGEATINDIDVTMGGSAINTDFENLKMVIDEKSLTAQNIPTGKIVSFQSDAKINAKPVNIALYADVTKEGAVGNKGHFSITKVNYTDKDEKETEVIVKDGKLGESLQYKHFGEDVTIGKAADTNSTKIFEFTAKTGEKEHFVEENNIVIGEYAIKNVSNSDQTIETIAIEIKKEGSLEIGNVRITLGDKESKGAPLSEGRYYSSPNKILKKGETYQVVILADVPAQVLKENTKTKSTLLGLKHTVSSNTAEVKASLDSYTNTYKKKLVEENKPATLIIDNSKTPAAKIAFKGEKHFPVSEFQISSNYPVNIDEIDVSIAGSATNLDFNNLDIIIKKGDVTLHSSRDNAISELKLVKIQPNIKMDTTPITISIYTDVLDSAIKDRDGMFNISRIQYSNDRSPTNLDLINNDKAKGKLITIKEKIEQPKITIDRSSLDPNLYGDIEYYHGDKKKILAVFDIETNEKIFLKKVQFAIKFDGQHPMDYYLTNIMLIPGLNPPIKEYKYNSLDQSLTYTMETLVNINTKFPTFITSDIFYKNIEDDSNDQYVKVTSFNITIISIEYADENGTTYNIGFDELVDDQTYNDKAESNITSRSITIYPTK